MASVEQPAVEPESAAGAGIVALYRAVWDAVRGTVARERIAIAVEIALIAIWFLLRTRYGVESRPYLLWTIVAAGIAVVSPISGLVILAGTAPFFEPVSISRVLGMRHVLVAVLGISVAVRLVAGGWRRMPWSPPVILAIAIGVLTAIGVGVTSTRFSTDWTQTAAQTWLSSIGGAMIILVVAVWAARDGSWRAVVAACAAAVVAGGLSLIDHFAPGAVANGPLGWIGFWKDFNGRLGGAVPSPNGMAALLIVPTAVLIFWGILGRGRAWARVAALAIAAPMLVALYVTYSRAALLALFVLAVILCWRIRRTLGIAVLVMGIAGGAVLLPSYLQLRSQSALEGAVTPGSILVASDEYRFRAWSAATRMWQDQPITGQGFLAYKQLADSYGDPVLGSPHNEWLRLLAEEGTVGGLVGLSFLATTLWWLARRCDAIGGGILSGVAGYFLMASFNNPLLFTQISAVVFVALGHGLARAHRQAPEAVQLGPPSPENGLPPEDLPPQANEALLA
jgi:O-antigen ligase